MARRRGRFLHFGLDAHDRLGAVGEAEARAPVCGGQEVGFGDEGPEGGGGAGVGADGRGEGEGGVEVGELGGGEEGWGGHCWVCGGSEGSEGGERVGCASCDVDFYVKQDVERRIAWSFSLFRVLCEQLNDNGLGQVSEGLLYWEFYIGQLTTQPRPKASLLYLQLLNRPMLRSSSTFDQYLRWT